LIEAELSVAHLLLQEYEKLKAEQLARINARDNLLYVTLASLGAVLAATLQTGVSVLLLALPPVGVVLGWTYLMNDEKVSAIGRHIRTVLAPQLASLLAAEVPVFSWEVGHRGDRGRRWRKGGQLAIDLLTFCAPAVVAVITYWFSRRPNSLMVSVSVIELAAIAALGWAIVTSADLVREPAESSIAPPRAGTHDAG
jgi:hypothetical protein